MKITSCPVCGVEVMIVRRSDGSADHYEPLTIDERLAKPNPCPSVLADFLRASRKGKKTVALIGAAPATAAWAPFGEEDVEIWASNELHAMTWMQDEYITKWWQVHPKWSFTRDNQYKHWEWLREEHDYPIYMIHEYDDVPSGIPYPLQKIQKGLINIVRGELPVKKCFSSTFNYQMALALDEGFERIELYGIEMLVEYEYKNQREMMAFWLGKADGMGVEVWLPEQCTLMREPLYGYEQQRKGMTGEIEKPPDDWDGDDA